MANLLLGCTGILVRDPVTPASEAWANLSTVPTNPLRFCHAPCRPFCRIIGNPVQAATR